ncbi:sugar-binding domain-containing protein [Aquimarina algiphila]|uniref:sugar-binding domain-containing protein n=1 Tax=Aquimarina algiphila TaxID=2047982 RepID=UPI001FCC2710|nr:sugar-binding domain-containing protein [Aquimarina algiphila]
MNFYIKMLSYCSVIWLFIGCQDTQFTIAKTIKINDNWKFVQEDIPKAKEIDFDDSRWETVDLPHDWSISKPFSQENPSFSRGAWLPAGISYYRKNIDLSEIGENQKVFIHFEGAYRNAEVWINNHFLGKRPSGYAAFEYGLTPFISSENENIITVKLDNSEQPGSRWYSGNGIYRDVYLIRILKEMGANAVRTAHNPFDTEFLETCDEMGMLVMNEAFDEWEIAKEPQTFREKGNKIRIPVSYYAHLFKEYSDKDLIDFVIRDRNHPSIFMWSIGNEIDQMHDESGVAIAKRLSNIIHKYDYRPATCGVNGYGWDKWPHEPAVAQIDVPGYNYAKGKNYDKEHDDFPNRKMIVTEHTSAQMIANRGEYYPFKNKDQALQLDLPIEHPDTEKFLKSRNFYAGGMQACQDVKNRSFVMGAFIWTGWDYLGETIPYAWPARSSSFGVIDLAGFPKDGYYYYQSEWSDKPMIHTFPHWNWKGHEGEKINLNVFSNTKEVELFVNGVSQGKKINNSDNADMLSWEVLYQPGTVKAIGYTDGRKIIEEEIKTAGTTNSLQLEVTDSSEVTYIEVTALDVNGIFVATAENLINFEVEKRKNYWSR